MPPPTEPTPDAPSLRMLHISGALDIHTVPPLRRQLLHDIHRDRHTPFSIVAENVTHIDGVGLGLIAELRGESQRLYKRPLEFTGLPPAIAHLVALSALDASLTNPPPHRHVNSITALGKEAVVVYRDVIHLVDIFGQIVAAAASIIRNPSQVRWREFPALASTIGADAFLIIALLGFLIGAILAFQTAVPLDRFGAVELIPTIVGIAIVRELGPLIAAILVAGRTGAAFAAEIGTMRVTEELSALRVIGISPLIFLVFPRVLATVLMLPILCIYTDLLGIFGGFTVMEARGFSLAQYMESLKSGVQVSDVAGGVIKTIAFAALIATAGCQSGLQTGAGPGAVGRSTTRAVVTSIVLIIIADLFFGFIYYELGF